ncbi:hypothetical protein J6590_101114 [Homalodisca vitripennis]|nr:hypothetical protein J6590_101114 [Homalodisca vitripennis]
MESWTLEEIKRRVSHHCRTAQAGSRRHNTRFRPGGRRDRCCLWFLGLGFPSATKRNMGLLGMGSDVQLGNLLMVAIAGPFGCKVSKNVCER